MKDFENRVKFDLDLSKEYEYIVGIDEAGWGSIAGPISVGFSVIPTSFLKKIKELSSLDIYDNLRIIKDSKRVSELRRKKIIKSIEELNINCFTTYGHVSDINTIGMSASLDKAISEGLKKIPENSLILMDGSRTPKLDYDFNMIVKGDDKSWSIALASIFAKTLRDNFMTRRDNSEAYQWNKNKGYATKDHIELIKELGLCSGHRINACRKFVK